MCVCDGDDGGRGRMMGVIGMMLVRRDGGSEGRRVEMAVLVMPSAPCSVAVPQYATGDRVLGAARGATGQACVHCRSG